MINEESLKSVEHSSYSDFFVKPLYSSFCFSRIPSTISYLLTGKNKEKTLPTSCFEEGPFDGVILLFLDAFGWKFFTQYAESHPLLQRFVTKGIASKLTSQFPSTTTAHVTTMHTAQEVGQTGLYEWFQYEPLLERMISPLPFCYAGDHVQGSLLSSSLSLTRIFPFSTFYQHLQKTGVESHLFQDADISSSPYSQSFSTGAHCNSFLHFTQGLSTLRELFMEKQTKTAPTYAFLYYSHIDSTGHRKGPSSPSFAKTITHCLDCIEKNLASALAKNTSKKIALLITADHGMVDVKPKKTIYINLLIPELISHIKISKGGHLEAPAGSCRDLFLHIQEGKEELVLRLLQKRLLGKAEVHKVTDLIKGGFFGEQTPSKRFLDRVGNIVILPYEEESVWWFEPHKFQQNFYGAHGGLTRAEMEIPFLFLANHAN